jgi:hypothetical protein
LTVFRKQAGLSWVNDLNELMFFIHLHKVSFFFFLFFFAIVSNAQHKIVIKANVDKNNVVIGEQIHFKLEADFPPHEPIRFFSFDSIPHFEIVERKKIDTIDNNKGINLSQSLTLTSFDSGHWVIPAFELAGDTSMFTDTIPINVSFSPFDPNQDYHDIKDVIDVKAEEKKKKDWYWYVAASVLIVATIIYLLARKKKRPEAKAPPVDPFTEAKQELEKLRRENPASKLFYTRLVDIFRLYVLRRKGIESLQKTTDDLVVQLKLLKLPGDDFNQLAQALRMSDFVKFAKYEPSDADKQESFNIIKRSIENIQKQTIDSPPGRGS